MNAKPNANAAPSGIAAAVLAGTDPAKTKPEALLKATADAGYPSTLNEVQ